ncbi:unnamed protein product [Amoebophrya sp. A120]|nr:unnamed protein product [Amoebophrya sp. A120]|eukprot:GSA120T00007479001.1
MKSPTLSSSTLRKQSLLSGTTDTTTEQPSASNSFFGTSALTNSKEITTSDQHNNLQNSNYAQPFVNDPSLDYVRNSRVVEPLTPDAVGLVKKDQNYIPLSAIVMHRPIPKPLEFDDASSDHTYRSSAAASSNRFLLPREKNTDAFCSTYQHDVEAPVREDPQWRERSRHLSQKVVQSESEDVASIRVAAATSGADEEAATDNFSVAFSGAESRQRNISYNSNGVNQQVAGDHGQASKRDEHLRKISENENTHTFCGLPVPSMHDWD